MSTAKELGRKVHTWMVALGLAMAVGADAVAAAIGHRAGEVLVYLATAALLVGLGYNIERVNRFVEE